MAAAADDRHRLVAGLGKLGLDAGLADTLLAYVDLLTRWNRAYNLSAVREPSAMIERHVLDSLAILPWLPDGALLDLGSGAGLPGLPVAMAEPERAVTLLDTNGKKTRFLDHVALTLRLANVEVVKARAEQWQAPAPYAVVTSRAYTELAGFWRHAAPQLAPDGRAVAMKGRYPEDELAALPESGVSWTVERVDVPGLDAERHVVILQPSA